MPRKRVSRIVLFCEDDEHEAFVRAVLRRLGEELESFYTLAALSARGGRPRAIAQLRLWQRSLPELGGTPDLLILLIDANCHGWSNVRQELVESIDPAVVPRHVIGCPDPHLERWLIADPSAFRTVLGVHPGSDPGKCDRLAYKQLLGDKIAESREMAITGAIDLIPDLVAEMEFYRAGKNQQSLGHFLGELRQSLQLLRAN